MARKYYVWVILAAVLGLISLAGACAQAEAPKVEAPEVEAPEVEAPEVEAPQKVEKSVCLACHGSFDDIAAATADYKAPSGEIVSPHRYVPHEEGQYIPECVECHKPHPIPPEGEVTKPDNIDWCYNSCHHVRTLQACKDCH